MSLEIKIPAVGESITSGLLSVWHKNDGDAVQAGEALLTLETDKVSTEITAEKAGTLRVKIPAGNEVKIGEVVGSIESDGAAAAAPAKSAEQVADDKSDAKQTREHVEPPAAVMPKTPATSIPKQASSEVERSTAPSISEAVAAANVSLSVISENAVQPVSEGRITRKKLSPLRRKIAQQLVMAQHTAAILTTFNECDMTAVMKLRASQQDAFTKEHGIKLGFMS
ncbi:MAG TPA: biotin/lipoyl-containing protein, partial [Chthoniobacter sp.]|nr:biotin/lipoyl-containing protein [Chthoniobacter sp.]